MQLEESSYPEIALHQDLEKKLNYLNALSDFFTHRKLFSFKLQNESSIEKILKKNLLDLEMSLSSEQLAIKNIELSIELNKREIKEESQNSAALICSKGEHIAFRFGLS